MYVAFVRFLRTVEQRSSHRVLGRQSDINRASSLATAVHTLRSENAQLAQQLAQKATETATLTRQVRAAEAASRATEGRLQSAEAATRAQRDEATRLKATVHQVRGACATEVRKRDAELARLRKHLDDVQRGNRGGGVGGSLTITPGATGSAARDEPARGHGSRNATGPNPARDATAFLTKLGQDLSDENDALLGLVRDTLGTLRQIQGLPASDARHADSEQQQGHGDTQALDPVDVLPTDLAALQHAITTELGGLRALLTSPSFVSIDEVEMRDEEIGRLRAGWERMELRWRDALALMEGWRKRMGEGEGSVGVDELTEGLERVGEEDEEDEPELEDEEEGAFAEDAQAVADTGQEANGMQEKDEACKSEASQRRHGGENQREPQHPAVLREANGNGIRHGSPTKPISQAQRPSARKRSSSPGPLAKEPSAKKATTRMHPPTVQDKLRAAQADAEAAAAAAAAAVGAGAGEAKLSRRPRRRKKSTLTPAELHGLLGLE